MKGDLMSLILSIAKAAKIAGSQRALAQQIGAQEQHISNWKKGARPCPLPQRIRIAKIAGDDTLRAALESLIEQLDTHDETQAGTAKMLQSMLDAFPLQS